MHKLYFLPLLLILAACGPKPQDGQTENTAPPAYPFVLLDQEEAADALVTDTTDRFFELVRPLEMAIQMKKTFPEGTAREEILNEYRTFLRTEATAFTQEEKEKVTAVMEQVIEQCNALHPDIFPTGVALVKIKTNHYGPSVYYTRENCIMIPENELAEFNPEAFLSVMLHEIFHVYSRFHPKQRRELYSLIGYYPIEEVTINEELSPLMLFNPDGVSYHWAIELELSDGPVQAVPIISANAPAFNPEKPFFFAYLNFGMHRLEQTDSGEMVIGESLGARAMGPLFERITTNTQYIIHPDEVLADNFMFLTYPFDVEQGEGPALSEEGEYLLEQIETVLKRQ